MAATAISHSFDRVVDALGLNAGVTDKRLRVTFHTLRHSCASLLVQAGTPLYTFSKILGHSTMRMTERYAHLAQDDLRHALDNVDAVMSGAGHTVSVVTIAKGGKRKSLTVSEQH